MFVTVGTTEFDELLHNLDSASFVAALQANGCSELTVQIGRGTYEFTCLKGECDKVGIAFTSFRFKPTLAEDMKRADMIISHCGAGSVLEAISLRKFLVVVVNPTLQGNHQTELADALAAEKYCISTEPSALIGKLEEIGTEGDIKQSIRPYPAADPSLFSGVVDSLFEWS